MASAPAPETLRILRACAEDLAAILDLQKLAFEAEARLYGTRDLPPLRQTLEELQEEAGRKVVLKALLGEALVGTVRVSLEGRCCQIARLAVHPCHQGQGIGSALLLEAEKAYPEACRSELFTGSLSEDNLRLYNKMGYRTFREQKLSESVCLLYLAKELAGSAARDREPAFRG